MAAILGHGVYSFSEAAKLTRLKIPRVREWFRGRGDGSRKPVFRSDYRDLSEDNLISFLDLIEVFIAGQLRSRVVALQTIRKVYTTLQGELDAGHPFCRHDRWQNMPIHEQAWKFIRVWPEIVNNSVSAKEPTVFQVQAGSKLKVEAYSLTRNIAKK